MSSLTEIRAWANAARPVFICGLERSGTSILQVSLARHPALFNVRDVYETFVFLRPRAIFTEQVSDMTAAYLHGGENVRKLRELVRQLSVKAELSEVDLIRTFFWFCANQVYPGKQPLEKTPGHVRRLPRLLEIFPLSRVIVCTRDPVEVVASYRKRLKKEQEIGKGPEEWGWLDKTPDQLTAHFRAVTNHIREAQARWPGRVFIAPYEWITEAPDAALKQICEFAALPFVPEVLTPKDVPGRKVDEMLSKPITKRDSEIEPYLNAEDVRNIRDKTADLMETWNTPGIAGMAPA
jgi:hypothetical protein